MDGSDFQQNKPQRCKIKNEVKTFYFGDPIRTWTFISNEKERVHLVLLFSNQRAARGFNSFLNLALRVKSLPTPVIAYGASVIQRFAVSDLCLVHVLSILIKFAALLSLQSIFTALVIVDIETKGMKMLKISCHVLCIFGYDVST